MIHRDLFPFLRKLARNNSKDWFNPQKAAYKEMRQVFTDSLEEMSADIAAFDSRVERYLDQPGAVKVFRIYRDTRFHKHPIPLKTNISGYVSGGPEGPFYYVQVGPGESFAGGGIYLPSSPLLAAIREEIADHWEELDAIVHEDSFSELFPEGLKTEYEVKTAPRGFPKDHPGIAYLRKKSFTVSRAFSDEEVESEDFEEELLRTFEGMLPLHRFLCRAFGRIDDPSYFS